MVGRTGTSHTVGAVHNGRTCAVLALQDGKSEKAVATGTHAIHYNRKVLSVPAIEICPIQSGHHETRYLQAGGRSRLIKSPALTPVAGMSPE